MTIPRPDVYDSSQLTRIENVHRGFFYQHLYAVGCLLLAAAARVEDVFIETDEDIELHTQHDRWYVQVKTRAKSLIPSDVADTLSRFHGLRDLHLSGTRQKEARFVIVANVEPSVALTETLPEHVLLVTPHRAPPEGGMLPPATMNVSAALAKMSQISSTVPFSRLTGETLTLKLAALIQMAASGAPPFTEHRFRTVDGPGLFEQITIQLQDFPPADPLYEPQQNEPAFDPDRRIRIITAISGGGKSAWAAEVALTIPTPVLYFDVGDTPAGTVATTLAREFAATLATRGRDTTAAVLPGRSGLDSLRTLDVITREYETRVVVFIDNAHRVGLEEIRAVLAALPHQQLILLGHPSEGFNALATLLSIPVETLQGWSLTSIAKVFAHYGAPTDLTAADRVRAITGGTPLYVRQAAKLTTTHFDGDSNAFCSSISSGTHTVTTAQETILRNTVAGLDEGGRFVLAATSVADVPLSRDEIIQIVSALIADPRAIAAGIRLATDRGILVGTAGGALALHDAFRVLGTDIFNAYDPTLQRKVRHSLRGVLFQTLGQHGDVRRISLLLRTLGALGETDVLLDAITTEFFHEFGLSTELEQLIIDALRTPGVAATDRFWALDTLAFWRLQDGDIIGAEAFVADMERELEQLGKSNDAAAALHTKNMLLAARRGKRKESQARFREALQLAGEDILIQRIVRYNYAVAAYWFGRVDDASKYAWVLAEEYVGALGLRWADIVAVNPDVIAARLRPLDSAKQDVLKHLADCLELFARSATGGRATLARVNAVKLYSLAWAGTSVVRVGMDAVDDLLRTTDPFTARKFIESTLLPALQHFRLLNHVTSVRAQYAVVLAYCGDAVAASVELEAVRPFVAALSEHARDEFENQAHLIAAIIGGQAPADVSSEHHDA
jgi:hypothetical protein